MFVVVAGGLGERLGFSGIKIAISTEITTRTSYIELYISNILSLQAIARKEHPECVIPLMVMTSDDTHASTMELLRTHNYYGMLPDQVCKNYFSLATVTSCLLECMLLS